MSREILFGGKRQDNGEWVYGSYVICLDEDDHRELHLIIPPYTEMYRFDFNGGCYVIPETVGQFTGLTDKNGKKIFEGDIIKTKEFGKDSGNGVNFNDFDIFEVIYSSASFKLNNSRRLFNMVKGQKFEVIGNIFDNAELLQKK